jgi:hypothetical protein
MTDAVWVAMIVAVPTTIAPVLLRITDSRARQNEKQQDYARQDAVAAQARLVAERLELNQVNTRRQVERIETSAMNERRILGGKLDEIHQFVNSDMTAQKRTNLALLQEIVALKRAAGDEPSEATLKTIRDLEEEIRQRDEAQDAP